MTDKRVKETIYDGPPYDWEIRVTEFDRLARFILDEVPGEPSQSEGAVDTAIRLIRAALTEGDTQ